MTTYTLFELNTYIRQVIALNFEEPIWITCELSQVNDRRGNVYLDLIQHEDGDDTNIIATSAAIIWYNTASFLKKKLGELYQVLLQPGTQVSVKVQIDYNERYGLKLLIVDIDPAYTLGQLELARQKTLERLKADGVLDLNKQTPMPLVSRRIAVVSSPQAAGYVDFKTHLMDNPYGYGFCIDLYQAAMQGARTESEVVAALMQIQTKSSQYDVVDIIRGGGSKLDLSAFDHYNIGYMISQMTLPVLTGIGHEIDDCIADIVAFKSLKTPTAVADYILDQVLQFEADLIQMAQWIKKNADHKVKVIEMHLQAIEQSLFQYLSNVKRNLFTDLNHRREAILEAAKAQLKSMEKSLDHMGKIAELSSPLRVLKLGYTLTRQEGRVVNTASELDMNKSVQIEWHDGVKEINLGK